jgi:hypothetical protein
MSQEQSSEIAMLSRILLVAVTTIGFAAASQGAHAAQSSRQKTQLTTSQTATIHARSHRPGPRQFSSRARSAGGTCGVWVCILRNSNGGCLVSEKTLCKIKIIDPFN